MFGCLFKIRTTTAGSFAMLMVNHTSVSGMSISGGRSTAGYITIVLKAEDLQKTYEEIKSKGISIDLPRRADWGGQELVLNDPDGNVVMIL
ncbi:MAG: VOC family protein [Bacillota bacterium]|nr:VOC family protein [Bacillota bacterium]HPZ55288.1 VOC family protein [Bacillota bacterium]HQD18236.1 VOC family protein [Bacillota bacterium]